MNTERHAELKSVAGESIALAGVRIDGHVDGCLLELVVEQRYVNREPHAIEAVYTFPLPLAAVLLSFELQIGVRKLAGVVTRKPEAAARYEDALDRGDTAVLLERARDGLYTVSLGNLMPGEEASIRFRYGQLLEFEQGRIRIAIPTTIAPRYGDERLAVDAHQAPVSDLLAHYPCTLGLTLRGPLATARAHSPTHRLTQAATHEGLRLATDARCVLDRDLVVLLEDLAAPAASVLARDGEGTVALISVPAPAVTRAGAPRRSLKVVVDCSGSMAGDSIHQARDAILRLLSTLEPADHVSLTRFGSAREHLTNGLVPVTPGLLLDLNRRVRHMEADLGGTEMQAALEAALALPAPAGTQADVVLITDGEIWGVDALILALESAGHRLFVIAVGVAPNEELARRVAAATGGACEFVTPGEDMRDAVDRVLVKLAAPVAGVGEIGWPMTPSWTIGTDRVAFPGETVHILAGFDCVPVGEVIVRFTGRVEAPAFVATLPTVALDDDALARVAAMGRIATLSHAAAASLAEHYQLVTRFTSCVVVLERADGERAATLPVLRQVPQMPPAALGIARSVGGMPPPPRLVLEDDSFMCAAPRVPEWEPDHAGFRFDAGEVDARLGAALAEILRRIILLLEASHPLPTTLAGLHGLGVGEDVLVALRALVDEGIREADVVAAWLAELVARPEVRALIAPRLQRRVTRAADRAIRHRIALDLA